MSATMANMGSDNGQGSGNGSMRDNRWLTLEVCREYQRSKCSRTEQECKYAHPPAHVEVQNGRVTCCFDSIKGKCNRKDPPCKYLHPPAHLKEQLLQNGRNNLVARNMVMQQMQLLQQLSANPSSSAANNVPVMYPSSGSLASAQQAAVLNSNNSLYPQAAYLGTLNGSPSPTPCAGSANDVSNALQSALLNAQSQQSGNSSNQLLAALLGQLNANGASASAGLTAQQQHLRALQLQTLLAAAQQQKQMLAASGYASANSQSLSALQNLASLQAGFGTLQNASVAQTGNSSVDVNANANSANALLQSLSTYASNGSQQRPNADCIDYCLGARKRPHADANANVNVNVNASVASGSQANHKPSASAPALTGSSTNAYDLLPLEQNQLFLQTGASGMPAALAAKRVASMDARTGLPCYNPVYASANVSLVPSPLPTMSLSNNQHALLAALSGFATSSTLQTAPQQASTAAFLQQPSSLGHAQSAGLPIAKIVNGGNSMTSGLATGSQPTRY